MSTHESVQIVKDFFAAVGPGDKLGLLFAVFGLVAAGPAQRR